MEAEQYHTHYNVALAFSIAQFVQERKKCKVSVTFLLACAEMGARLGMSCQETR